MRILLVNKFHYRKGGAERAYFDTARILAENGHQVAFFSMQHPENLPTVWSKYFVSQVDYLNSQQSGWSKLRAAFGIIWNFEAARNLERLIVEFAPDVAHLHNVYHQLSPSILWVLHQHRIPIVMTLHDYKAASPNYNLMVRGQLWPYASGWRAITDRAVKDSYLKSLVCALEWWFHRWLKSYCLVNQYIAPSHFLIGEYHALGFPQSIDYVPQPLTPFPTEPVQSRGGEYFLFAGRISPEKGARTLLEAFARRPQFALVIAGSGPDEVQLRQAYGHLPNVTWLGHLTGESLAAVFQKAKAIVLPSEWYENMPYALLEALGYGLPVIGSNLGGIPERVQDGQNGFLFEAGNVASLVAALDRYDTSDHEALRRKAWESIQDLREAPYAKTLLALYHRLLDSH